MRKGVRQFIIYSSVTVIGMTISHFIPREFFIPWVIVSLTIGHLINKKNYKDKGE